MRARSSACAAPGACRRNNNVRVKRRKKRRNLLWSRRSWCTVSDSPPWWSCPSSGRILGGPSAYWSTPPVLPGGLWMGPPRPTGPDKRLLVCVGGEEAPLWSSAWQLPLVSPENPKHRPNMDTHEKLMEKPKLHSQGTLLTIGMTRLRHWTWSISLKR